MRLSTGVRTNLFICAFAFALSSFLSAQTGAPAPATNSQPPTTTSATAPADQRSGDAKQADPNDADQDPVTTIKTQVREVNVIFTVTDKHGRFKKDLKQEDLHILDDGKAPEQIRDFRSETDLPLRVGLLVDASNSIRDRFKFEQEAATEFLSSIVRPKPDLAFVIG